MNEEQSKVVEFHRRVKATINQIPTQISTQLVKQRIRIIEEELRELKEAMSQGDLLAVADALADIEYAILGTAVVYGIDLEPIFKEIHRSNMTKLPPLNKDEKGMKGLEYSPPNLVKVWNEQGW